MGLRRRLPRRPRPAGALRPDPWAAPVAVAAGRRGGRARVGHGTRTVHARRGAPVAGRRSGPAAPGGVVHVAGRARGAVRRRAAAHRAHRRRGRGGRRLPAGRAGLGAGRHLVPRRVPARGGGPRAARERGPVVRRTVRREAARRRPDGGHRVGTGRRGAAGAGGAHRGGGARPAADAFIVAGPDLVAGYPWFGAWSRDTMIAFEGLFLATGRAAEGRELLRRYAAMLDGGQLPNTADTGQVEYNAVDATLWFVHAVDTYVRATGDPDLGVELLPALEGIRAAHERGTRYGIRADSTDSLLISGLPGHALTWMDARVHGVAVTPRMGKPVEVNALWINALNVLAGLREHAGRDATEVRARAARATTAFRQRYPAPGGGLFDVLDPADPTTRPNQLLAYALPHAPLRGKPVPTSVDALVTPLGLRTLAPDAPGYRGRHRGGPAERDTAYHQGTVWPWLLGPYVEARRAAGQNTDGLLTGVNAHLREYGLGSVSETAEGDPPHAATGCPFQAWSVAEILRIRRMTLRI